MLETIPEEFKDNKGDYIAVKTAGKIVGDIILDRANYEQNTFKLIINRIKKATKVNLYNFMMFVFDYNTKIKQ